MFPRDESGRAGRPPGSQDHPEFWGGERHKIEMTKKCSVPIHDREVARIITMLVFLHFVSLTKGSFR